MSKQTLNVIAAYVLFFGAPVVVTLHELSIVNQPCGLYESWLLWDKDTQAVQEQGVVCKASLDNLAQR